MRNVVRVSLGLFAFGTIALAAMPVGTAAAQSALLKSSRSNCTLEQCVEAAQQTYTCCKNPDADGCEERLDAALGAAPRKTCAQILVSDIAECPGEVLTCEIEALQGGGGINLGGGLKK